MAQKVVAVEHKLLAVLSAGLTGINVSEVCRQLGISRQSFYKYRSRFNDEGPAGLVQRSRRPHRSPGAIDVTVEDEIVRLRKTLRVDNGAQAIAYHLARAGISPPAVSTIHRVLVRRGFVTPQPHKRPKSATKRFVWPRPNDAWQIDATRWLLCDGREAWIMDILDDHSRVLVAARVCDGPTAAGAWDAFCHGAADWGLPAHVMSDNGTCFTRRLTFPGHINPTEAAFERNLRTLGIRHIPSSPGHPQTCGKLERSHQTTKRWLATLDPPATFAALQTQLDDWRAHYNHHRPHRGIDGATPYEAWTATDRATPHGPLTVVPHSSLHTVCGAGHFGFKGFNIHVGRQHAGHTVLVIAQGHDLTVFGDNTIIRRLTLDPTRRYQPSGNPRGRPKPNNGRAG